MLSRVLQRSSLARASRILPRADASHFGRPLVSMPMRNFQGHLGLDSTVDLVPQVVGKDDQVALWKDIKAKQENALVLKSNDEIEQYVLSVVKGYFRTTKKASVGLDSHLTDHGLDSLDVIELVI